MFRSIVFGMAFIVALPPVLADDAAIKCSKIDDATARLFCYDSLFRPHLRPETPVVPISTEEVRVVDDPAKDFSQGKGETKKTSDALPSFGEEQIKPNKRKAKPNDDTKINQITATIKNVSKRPMGEFAFEMENGQIWHQQSVGYFKVKAGDTVVLIRHRAGGYSLRSPGGLSTRVRRVR